MFKPTKQSRLSDPGEMDRLKAIYAGIFPNNIKEFAEMTKSRINKPRTNYSK